MIARAINSNSPSGAFQRGQFGASKQSSCTAGLDGLCDVALANEDTPTRGGSASADPLRSIGALSKAIVDDVRAQIAVEGTDWQRPDVARPGGRS